MGIKLIPKVYPELTGCVAYGYSATYGISGKYRVSDRQLIESAQRYENLIHRIVSINEIAAEAHIYLGTYEGIIIQQGHVLSCDHETYALLKTVLRQIYAAFNLVVRDHNIISCLIVYDQTIAFKNIER